MSDVIRLQSGETHGWMWTSAWPSHDKQRLTLMRRKEETMIQEPLTVSRAEARPELATKSMRSIIP